MVRITDRTGKSVKSSKKDMSMLRLRRLFAIAPAAVLFTFYACGGMGPLGESVTEEWTHTYPLAAGGEIDIDNTNGRVEVEAVDGATVEVRAEKIAKGATESAARELLPRITITEDIKPDRVGIATGKMSGIMIGASFEVRYHVKAPKAATLKVSNTNGSITISAMSGNVVAHGTNGGVTGKALTGGVDASVVNGAVNIDVASVGSQKISLHTTNGGVTLALPDDAKGDVQATCVNGGISVTGRKNRGDRADPPPRRRQDERRRHPDRAQDGEWRRADSIPIDSRRYRGARTARTPRAARA